MCECVCVGVWVGGWVGGGLVLVCVCAYYNVYCVQSEEDPNLGKEWFHDSISREEVVDILTHSEIHVALLHTLVTYYTAT